MAEGVPDDADVAALDAFVEAEVQRALEPYRGSFATSVLALMKEELACFMSTHPAAWHMLARLYPRGAQVIGGTDSVPEPTWTVESDEADAHDSHAVLARWEPDAATHEPATRIRALDVVNPGAAANRAFEDFALAGHPGDVFTDTQEALFRRYRDLCDDVMTALAIGAASHLWRRRGEKGVVLHMDHARTTRRIRDEVAGLPEQLALVLELRYFQERRVEDVASAMGATVPSVMRLIGEAVRLLRARLLAQGGSDPPVIKAD